MFIIDNLQGVFIIWRGFTLKQQLLSGRCIFFEVAAIIIFVLKETTVRVGMTTQETLK